MKKVSMAAAAFALTGVFSLFASAAMAKEVDIKACTKDGKTATLRVNVVGGPAVEKIVREVFTAAANTEDAEMLASIAGSTAFHMNLRLALDRNKLSDDALVKVLENPAIGAPACSVTTAP